MRTFRFWAAGLMVAIVVAIAGLAIAPMFASEEGYRASLVETIERATTGNARIGAVHVRFLPPARLTIEQLVINDGPDDRAGARLTARSVKADLAWGPLLRGVMQITAVEASGVTIEWPGMAPIDVTIDRFTPGDRATSATVSATLGKLAPISGTVSIEHTDTPTVRFDLATPLLDLGEVVSVRSNRPPRSDQTASSPGPRRLIAEGHVRAKRLRLPPLEATDGDAPVRVFTDRIEVLAFSMGFYDGMVDLNGRVDRTVTPATFTTDIHVRDSNLTRLMEGLGSGARVTGTAEGSLALAGQFGDGLIDSLTGQGSLDVRDGTVPGFRATGLMGTLARMQDAVTFGSGTDQYADTIPYRSFAGDITIATGRILSKRLVLDSPAGTVSLHGYLALDQQLHYDGLAALVRGNRPTHDDVLGAARDFLGSVMGATVGRVRIPFMIRGHVARPRIGPRVGLQNNAYYGAGGL